MVEAKFCTAIETFHTIVPSVRCESKADMDVFFPLLSFKTLDVRIHYFQVFADRR